MNFWNQNSSRNFPYHLRNWWKNGGFCTIFRCFSPPKGGYFTLKNGNRPDTFSSQCMHVFLRLPSNHLVMQQKGQMVQKIDVSKNLLGQLWVLQLFSSTLSPVHSPPFSSSTDLALVLVFVPMPQVLEHLE